MDGGKDANQNGRAWSRQQHQRRRASGQSDLESTDPTGEGYKGTADIRLAADAGELQGACWAWESIRATWTKALQTGDAIPLVQVTAKRQPDLPNVPLALELAKTEEAKQIIRAGGIAPSAVTRVYVTTPKTPKDRVDILRKAFANTLKDPEFLLEAKKAGLEVNPLDGEEVKKVVDSLFALNPQIVAKLSSILTVKQ
jgi:tripartite-type tricarboxylate transporter receptor subunit TctC